MLLMAELNTPHTIISGTITRGSRYQWAPIRKMALDTTALTITARMTICLEVQRRSSAGIKV